MSDVAKRHVLLIGMMGAGKTTVGRVVAERLGWKYLDSDAQVVANTGMTVPEIFERDGEPAFRRQETIALQQAVACNEPTIVSVAGGAVLDPGNRALLKAGGVVIWLRARPETLIARIGMGSGRPLLQEDPATLIPKYDSVRRPIYTELADIVIDVDDLGPHTIAGRVIMHIEHEGPGLQ